MDIIPAVVQVVVEGHLKELLYWFSDEMYRRLWRRAQGHFLVRLRDHLDTGPLEAACAAYHHSSGPGAPVVHPMSRLVRALLVKYLLDLSLRELEQAIQWNLLVKGFVGYALFEAGPDHATLARFEQWVWEHQPRTFFDQILRQIDEDFPEERGKAQMGDTYALRANAATESLIRLLRHSCQRLLWALAESDAQGHGWVVSQLDAEALFGTDDEVKEYRLRPAERRQRLESTVVAVVWCLSAVRSWLVEHPASVANDAGRVTTWLVHLDKILADEVELRHDEHKQGIAVQEWPKEQKGSYRLASATDPEATYRVHGEQIDFGYNVNVAATDSFIREIRADTGAQPDALAIAAVLSAQQEHLGAVPAKFIYDKAAGTGKWHAAVEKVTDGRTQLVAPLIPYEQRRARFGPDDFVLSSDGQSLTCPQGQVSATAYRSQSGEGRTFRFAAPQCAGCALLQPCRGEQAPATHMRQVYISDHRSVLAKARTYARTLEFQQDLKQRSIIERIIANLVRYHGARHARRRGQSKCDFQAKMNATAFNIRQWLRRLERQAKAPVEALTLCLRVESAC